MSEHKSAHELLAELTDAPAFDSPDAALHQEKLGAAMALLHAENAKAAERRVKHVILRGRPE